MASFEERLAARREQLQQERTVVLPILGYEDMLAARYRILGQRKLKEIGKRNEELPEDEQDIADKVDTLINACVELLEVKGDDQYASTGKKWTTDAVRSLFKVDLPDGATARDAVLSVFPPTETELLLHFNAYDRHLVVTAQDVDKDLLGESVASSAPEEQSISQ